MTIRFHDKYLEPILNGSKIVTIRYGIKAIGLGNNKAIFSDSFVYIQVTKIIYCGFKELNGSDLFNYGFFSLDEAVENLKEFYPNITENSVITYIKFIAVGNSCKLHK